MLLMIFITCSFVACYYRLILRCFCGSGYDDTYVPSDSRIYCTNKVLSIIIISYIIIIGCSIIIIYINIIIIISSNLVLLLSEVFSIIIFNNNF